MEKPPLSEIAISSGPEPEFAALLGIDWADQKHTWCLQAADSTKRETGELEHTPEAIESWVAQLVSTLCATPDRGRGGTIVKGALVFMLSKYGPLHLFPVPPQMACQHAASVCTRRAPRMILEMLTCCWIYCCSIATSCVVYRPIAKPPVEYRIWWRSDANWWMKRRRKSIA